MTTDQQLIDTERAAISLPIKAVFALLAGCAAFTGTTVAVGMYFGSRDASASALSLRVDKLEEAVRRIPEIAEGVARLEGAAGTLPDDRKPAGRTH